MLVYNIKTCRSITMSDKEKYKYIIKNIKILDERKIANLINEIKDVVIIYALLNKLLLYFSKTIFLRIINKVDETIKIGYLNILKGKREYIDYYVDLLISSYNEEAIINYFKWENNIMIKLLIIDKIDILELKIKLINMIADNEYKLFALSNYLPYRRQLLESCSYEIINYIDLDIDKDITFGIELELRHDKIYLFQTFKNILGNYNVKDEGTVSNGLEITSPVLNYSYESNKELLCLCKLLRECGFTTNEYCGGHIHIGINYFKSNKEFLKLVEIYCNCEDILYIIFNKAGTSQRHNVNLYAEKIKKRCLLAIKLGDFENTDEMDLEEVINIFKEIMMDRYKGFNVITKYPTIEIRIPNGEIDFLELHNNIRLILRLVQKSCEIANMSIEHEEYQKHLMLREKLSLEDKLEVLLDLLFDKMEDKDFFRERYYQNTNKISRFIKNTTNKCFDKGVNFDSFRRVKKR